MRAVLALFSVILSVATAGGADDDLSAFNITGEIRDCLTAAGSRHKVSGRINPFYLRGDFRGDGRPETAVLVSEAANGEKGLLVCGPGVKPVLLGAGSSFQGMTNLDFDAWRVYPKTVVRRGAEAGLPPVLRSEALLLEWSEAASGLVYWDGRAFRWYQQGD